MNTVMVNEKATNAMLSGLGNVRVENANVYLNGAGLFVRPHIGRKRIRIGIPKEWLHGDKNDQFRKDRIEAGCITVLPPEDEAALQKLESAVRSKVKKLAIGMDSKFMPIEVYKTEFKPFFEDTKDEYFALRDKLVGNWNQIIADFEVSLHNYLITLPTYTPEMEKSILASIPSAADFARSFYMEPGISAFPVVENISILDPSVADDLRESTVNQAISMVHGVMGTILNEVNATLSEKILEHGEGKAFDGRTSRTLTVLINRVKKNNILKHEIVDNIVKDLNKIVSMVESRKGTLNVAKLQGIDEDIVENMEQVMIYIFGFANEVGIEIEETKAMSHATLAALCGITTA